MSPYTPYHEESAQYARQLCRNASTTLDKYRLITSYISRVIRYDYVRAAQIAKLKGQRPDISGCWSRHMGICMDTAALTHNMLRAVGIRSSVCIGYADRQYHAWIEADIGTSHYRYDHDGKAKRYTIKMQFT